MDAEGINTPITILKVESLMSDTFNIASWISEHSKIRPNQLAVLFPGSKRTSGVREYSSLTFIETEKLINRYARGFSDLGIRQGDRVSLFVKPCLEFMPITFALYKIGAVVVLIDPGMGKKGLLNSIATIKPRALVGVPKAMFASLVYPKYFKSVEIKVTVGNWKWLWGGYLLKKIQKNLMMYRIL